MADAPKDRDVFAIRPQVDNPRYIDNLRVRKDPSGALSIVDAQGLTVGSCAPAGSQAVGATLNGDGGITFDDPAVRDAIAALGSGMPENFAPQLAANGFTSIFKWLTTAQRAAVLARNFSADLSAAIQIAVNSGEALFFPAGGYRMDAEVLLPPTTEFCMLGHPGRTEIRAGAAIGQFFRKATFADGGDISPVFIQGFKFSCARLADRAFWIPVSKKGAVTNVIINDFLVEAWKGGDDSGGYTARFYENHIAHNIIDGGINYAASVGTMPLYGINLTENATDNIILGPEVGYVAEAGLRAVGGGNRSVGCHSYGSNTYKTGPKYNLVAGAFGMHDLVYADNVTVAGVKVVGDSVHIGQLLSYWAADNVPSVGGAVPVEINAGVGPFNVDSILIRNGNAGNPAVRFLGTFWGREWRLGGVVGQHTPQASTPAAIGGSIIPRSLRVIGQTGVEADFGVEAAATAVKAGYKWFVNSKLRYQQMTNAGGESGGNAGSNLTFGSYADDGTTYTEGWIHYRVSNQFNWTAKMQFNGAVGFYGTTPVAAKPTVSGSRGGNAALADLLTKLASLGLIADSTTV